MRDTQLDRLRETLGSLGELDDVVFGTLGQTGEKARTALSGLGNPAGGIGGMLEAAGEMIDLVELIGEAFEVVGSIGDLFGE